LNGGEDNLELLSAQQISLEKAGIGAGAQLRR